MPQEIYNEGRVVGLSAWELFKRTALSNGADPELIPNEEQWLASMFGMGASMILKIPAGRSGVQDFELPVGSTLSGANVIIANPFTGTCALSDSGWATKVTSYGPLILNNEEYSPAAGQTPEVPYNSYYSNYKTAIAEFLKITDGIVYTKGATWIPTEDSQPEKDIDPNFNDSSTVIRLYISEPTVSDVYVLFTGFLNKYVLQGISGYAGEEEGHSVGGSTDVEGNNWKNGAMLGPEIIPWATKIVFTVPSAAYALINSLNRTIPSDVPYTIPTGGLDIDGIHFKENAINGTIRPNSIIDFNSITLTDYYSVHNLSSVLLSERTNDVVLGIGDVTNTLVAWYPGMTAANIAEEAQASDPSNANFFPPALYAVQILASGTQSLVPLDVAAPGTVKGFEDPDDAANYKNLMPNNYAIYHKHTQAGDSFSFAIANVDSANWPGTAVLQYLPQVPKVQLLAGTASAQLVALTSSDGTAYITAGTNGVTDVGPENNITWDTMLGALVDGKTLDVLGTDLHNVGTELKASHTLGVTHTISKVAGDTIEFNAGASSELDITSTVGDNGNTKYISFPNGGTVFAGENFIQFDTSTSNQQSSLKLYISPTNPGTENVPIGSIGIGW